VGESFSHANIIRGKGSLCGGAVAVESSPGFDPIADDDVGGDVCAFIVARIASFISCEDVVNRIG
jgi:hypothetical protein